MKKLLFLSFIVFAGLSFFIANAEVGEPVPGADLYLEQEPDEEPIAFGGIDEDGVLEFRGLGEGTYTLSTFSCAAPTESMGNTSYNHNSARSNRTLPLAAPTGGDKGRSGNPWLDAIMAPAKASYNGYNSSRSNASYAGIIDSGEEGDGDSRSSRMTVKSYVFSCPDGVYRVLLQTDNPKVTLEPAYKVKSTSVEERVQIKFMKIMVPRGVKANVAVTLLETEMKDPREAMGDGMITPEILDPTKRFSTVNHYGIRDEGIK